MGTYAECTIDIDWIQSKKAKYFDDINKELRSKEVYARWEDDNDTLFVSSGRIQNLEFQLDNIKEVFKKYKEAIVELSGSVMIESGDGIYYNSEDEE